MTCRATTWARCSRPTCASSSERRRAAPKRKRSRRERLERQVDRTEEDSPAAAAEDAAPGSSPAPEPPPNITWWGVAGGLFGFGLFSLLGTSALIDPGDDSRVWSIAFYAVAVLFLPAIFYSIVPSPRRDVVLRLETVLCLVLAFVGFFVLQDIGWPIVLSPATVCLATASGLIFQGRGTGWFQRD